MFRDVITYESVVADVFAPLHTVELPPDEAEYEVAHYALARQIGKRVGLTPDDENELASRALILSRMPGADPVAQGLWGHRMKHETADHPLVEQYGGTMSKAGGVVTAKYSWRNGPSYLLTQDQIGPARVMLSRTNPEGEQFDLEIAVEHDLDVLDERKVELELSKITVTYGLFLNREQTILAFDRGVAAASRFVGDGIWSVMMWDYAGVSEQARLLDDLRKHTQPVSLYVEDEPPSDFDRRDAFAERISMEYPRDECPALPWAGGSTIQVGTFERAKKASKTRSDYLVEEWEQNDIDAILTEGLCEDEDNRNGAAVYLEPEYPHQENAVQALVDHVRFPEPLPVGRFYMIERLEEDRLNRNATFKWIANSLFRDERALIRLTRLARMLSPTEQVAFFREIAEETAAQIDCGEARDDVEDAIAYRLYELAGIEMDEDTEFYETRWLNLDNLRMPVDEIVEIDGEEKSRMPKIGDALALLTSKIGAVPGGKPWHCAEVRREEFRLAATTRCSWSYATSEANKLRPRFQQESEQAEKKDFVVSKLRPAGLVAGDGRFLTWGELLNEQVMFDKRDAASRLKAVILERVDDDNAREFAQGLA